MPGTITDFTMIQVVPSRSRAEDMVGNLGGVLGVRLRTPDFPLREIRGQRDEELLHIVSARLHMRHPVVRQLFDIQVLHLLDERHRFDALWLEARPRSDCYATESI